MTKFTIIITVYIKMYPKATVNIITLYFLFKDFETFSMQYLTSV